MYEAKLGFELKQASIYLADTIFEAKLDFEIEIAWQIQLSFWSIVSTLYWNFLKQSWSIVGKVESDWFELLKANSEIFEA